MTETPVNAHQPVTEDHRISCAAPGCGYALHTYTTPAGNTPDWPEHFRRQHTEQYAPGRAPDIEVDYAIEASCSVCTDGIGSVKVCHDGDRICCGDCGTHWSMDGTAGEREEESAGDDPADDPDATGGLLDQPPIACDGCDFTTTALLAAVKHAQEHPGHIIAGPGRIDGTTVRISTGDDNDAGDDDI